MDAQGALKIAGIASVRFPAFKTTDASRWPRQPRPHIRRDGENIFVSVTIAVLHHDRRSRLTSRFSRPRSPRAQAGYSAQMIGVPEMANKLYFKEGVRVRSARDAGSAISTSSSHHDATHGRGRLSLRSRRRSRLTAAPASPPAFFLKLNTQHPENKNMSRWFGHALATCSAAQILASATRSPARRAKPFCSPPPDSTSPRR